MLRVIAALIAGLLLCAQTPMLPGFPPGTFQNRAALDAGGGGSGGPSLALIGVVTDTGSGNATITLTGDIGTATATRVILIAANRQNGAFSGVAVNGQAASVIQTAGSGESEFWSLVGAAAGSGSQNIVLTGGTFELRNARAWIMDGLASTTKVQGSGTGSGNSLGSVSLLTGDYWFADAQTLSGSRNWSSSTPIPTNSYDDNTGGGVSAQWVIGSNTTGTATVSGGTTVITQVSFR